MGFGFKLPRIKDLVGRGVDAIKDKTADLKDKVKEAATTVSPGANALLGKDKDKAAAAAADAAKPAAAKPLTEGRQSAGVYIINGKRINAPDEKTARRLAGPSETQAIRQSAGVYTVNGKRVNAPDEKTALRSSKPNRDPGATVNGQKVRNIPKKIG